MAKLALDGGAPVHDSRKRPWPDWPPTSEAGWKQHEQGFREVYMSAVEGLPQPRARRFEKAYCEYLGSKHGLLVHSGSSALKVALAAVTDTDGVGYNGECIVPNYTFIASAHVAWEMGFSVRFVDGDPETGCLDPTALETAITPKTRVIIPVHILGCPADMDPILEIARKHNLKVVEDACQAHSASYKGRKVGSMGDAGCFSFQSSKNLTCGEGGFVATNSPEVLHAAYAMHNCGRAPEGVRFNEPRAGYNYRAAEYLPVLLENRLKELDAQSALRNRGAEYLRNELKGITGLRPGGVPDYVTNHGFHLFLLRYEPSAFGGHSREEFLRALAAEGIPCTAGYGDLLARHGMTAAIRKRHPEMVAEEPSPNTERICKEGLWFFHTVLMADPRDLADIPEAVRKIQAAWHA